MKVPNHAPAMRHLVPIVALLVSGSLWAQERSVLSESSTKLKNEFTYSPPSHLEKAKSTIDDVVRLPAFTVSESIGSRHVSQKIQDYAAHLKAQQFTVAHGGAIASKNFGKVQAQIGAWSNKNGFEILGFRW
jgi:hypothetical protein